MSVRRDLVLVRHAPTRLQEGVRAAEWQLAGGAHELTRELARSLRALELAAPANGEEPPVGQAPTLGPVELVLTSHEPKAIGTGRVLAAELGVKSATAPDLEEHHRERMALLEPDEWHRTLRRFFASPNVLLFGTETGAEAKARFLGAVRAAQAERPGRRLAIVSHATVMTLLLADANGVAPYDLWRTVKMPEAFVVDSRDFRIMERIAPAGAV